MKDVKWKKIHMTTPALVRLFVALRNDIDRQDAPDERDERLLNRLKDIIHTRGEKIPYRGKA